MDRKQREEKRSGVERMKDALYSRAAPPETDPAARTSLPRQREYTSHAWEDIHSPTSEKGGGPDHDSSVPQSGVEAVSQMEPLLSQQDRTIAVNVAKKFSPINRVSAPMFRENVRPDMMPAESAPKARKNHMALYFLGLALIFFIVAAGVAAFLFFQGTNTISAKNIELAIVAPSLTDSGKPAVIQYIITNRNKEKLLRSSLIVSYPEGTRSSTNMTQDLPQERLQVGDIEPGGQTIKTSSAVFFGTEGASKKITTTLEYRLAGSNAIFTKDSETTLILGSAPVSISVSAPDEAISGQAFDLDITVASNATAPLRNVALEANLPFGFSLLRADPSASVGNSLWHLGDLNAGESKIIHLSGALTGSDGDTRVFHFLAGSESDLSETSLGVPLLTSPLTITVRKPFISSIISIGGKSGTTATAPLGGQAQGTIAWQNNLPQNVTHAVFTLSLKGAPLDPSSISTTGFYDSSKSQIVWSEQTDPRLGNLAPGEQGSLQFTFKTLPPTTKLIANPHVDLALEVTAVRTGQGSVPETVTSAATMKVNIASAIDLAAKALHFSGVYKNTGPMPPVHNEPTTYTIIWTLKNSSNDVGNGVVTATLPPSVEFTATPEGSGITYDSIKRQVTWNVGNISIGAGYTNAVRTAAFQVTLTPSVTQGGQILPLTSDVAFTGADRYAGVTVTTNAVAPTTRLTDDPGFVQGMEMVK